MKCQVCPGEVLVLLAALLVVLVRGATAAAAEMSNDLVKIEGYEIMYFPDGEGVPRPVIMNPVPPEVDTGRSDIGEDVTFLLYTRKNPAEGQRLLVDEPSSFRSSAFDPSKPTRFLVHGWMSSANSSTVTALRDAYLSTCDCNVVAVDWSGRAASSFYWWSKTSVPEVGEHTGQLARHMADEGADAKAMHFVGHSLGAHVAGAAASYLSRSHRGARVTGLDPAMPGFQYYEYPEGRLDETDADFVQVIHTCSGALGYTSPIGHADFYPNNGTPLQPGCCCMPEVSQACSHARAHQYFAESITSDVGFYAVACDSWDAFANQSCQENRAVLMGEKTPPSARGVFYLSTNSSSPFALGPAEWMSITEEEV